MYVAKAETEDVSGPEAAGGTGKSGAAEGGTVKAGAAAGGNAMSGETAGGDAKLRMYFFRKPVTAADRTILVRFYRSMIEGYITSWIMDGMETDLKDEVERLLYLLRPSVSKN